MKFSSQFLLACLYLVSVDSISSIRAEETCDRESGCEDEYNNVWKEDHYPDEVESKKPKGITVDESILEYLKKSGVSLKRTELALLVHHLDLGDDGRVDQEDLETVIQDITAEGATMRIVQSVIKSFNRLDKNDDGKLTDDELPISESEDDDTSDDAGRIVGINQYLAILSRLGKPVAEALEPFLGLGFLSHFEMKTVIAGSVNVFQTRDVDGSGGLNMAEYLSQVNRPDNAKAQMLDESQKEKIFGMIDKDGDGEISYSEFQSVIPKGPPTMPTPKDMDEIFQTADKDGDGHWSVLEFGDHLKSMVRKTGAPEPKAIEILEAFAQLDKNEDGQVSFDEMKGIGEQIEKIQEEKAAQGFAEMDLDGDGVLTKDEMLTMATAMEEKAGQKVDVDQLMKMMDKNGNGVIELTEVTQMVSRMTPQMRKQ